MRPFMPEVYRITVHQRSKEAKPFSLIKDISYGSNDGMIIEQLIG